MARAAAHKPQHEGMLDTMAWRLSGQARIDRIRATSRAQHLTLGGILLSLVMVWHGVVFLPVGNLAPAEPFAMVISNIAPLAWWGVAVTAIGSVHLGGHLLAWMGYMTPVRRARIVVACFVSAYFALTAVALSASGYSFGPAIYIAATVLAVRDLNNALLAD